MVNLPSSNFVISVPLTIKWHLSGFSLCFSSLNQLKSGRDNFSSDLVRLSTLIDIVRGVVISITVTIVKN